MPSRKEAAEQRIKTVYDLHMHGETADEIAERLRLPYLTVKRDLETMEKRNAESYDRYKAGDQATREQLAQSEPRLREELHLREEKRRLVEKRKRSAA